MRCSYCVSLDIQTLVELAKVELSEESLFPRDAYYQHHTSSHDPERSAHEGCDLCGLLFQALASYSNEDYMGDSTRLF